MVATLGNLNTAIDKVSNKDEEAVDFLIMGPGLSNKQESQAKANKLLSIANTRKDCVACVGPHRADLVGISDATTQTANLINFFNPLQSTSYGVFDSGYAYKYDRFNNEFRFVPTNGDIAGLMVRTNITSYPWFFLLVLSAVFSTMSLSWHIINQGTERSTLSIENQLRCH